jgi:hypothetical protein
MKLGISYNLFDGEELLEYSIQSVRNSADHINVVYQKISNWGEPCSENLEDLLSDLVKKKLIDKIYCYTPKNTSASKNELHKRNIGLNIAKARFCSHFLNLDCDEFYHKNQFDEAKKFIIANKIESSSCKFINYIKNPTWQIQNYSQTYTPFIAKINLLTKLTGKSYFPVLVDPTRKMNGNKKFKYFEPQDLRMEHMWLVRKDLNKKFNNSSAKKLIKPEFIGEVLDYQHPGKFLGNDVLEVENVFKIKI